jgi:hypothetical protein
MSKTKSALTVKSLGMTNDVKLSEYYNNTKSLFRTVSDHVLGYYVVSGRPSALVRIAPIYKADTWIRHHGHPHALISSYEIGAYLNSATPDEAEPDEAGNALARIAADAIFSLERHAALRAIILKKKR